MLKRNIFDCDECYKDLEENVDYEEDYVSPSTITAKIIGAFKPFTAGHYNLIQKAAEECTNVQIYFSKKDRHRSGELPIYFEQSKYVFETYIAPNLPNNVLVYYSSNPTQEFYNDMGSDERLVELRVKENNINIVYTDTVDSNYIKNKRIANAFPKLTEAGRIQYKEIERSGDNNISATMARQAIKEGNFNEFKRLMPSFLTEDDLKRIMVLYKTTLLVPRVKLNDDQTY